MRPFFRTPTTALALASITLLAACSDATSPSAPARIAMAKAGGSNLPGRIFFSSDKDEPGNFDIYSIPAAGGAVARLTTDPWNEFAPSATPDGSRVAYQKEAGAFTPAWIMNGDGSAQEQMIPYSVSGGLMLSGDAQRLLYGYAAAGPSEIVVTQVGGMGDLAYLTINDDADYNAAWDARERRVVLSSDRDGDRELYVMNADGSAVTRLTNSAGMDDFPAWSPDGKKIAFVSDRDGLGGAIYVMNADGTAVTRLTPLGAFGGLLGRPAWSPSGKHIAFGGVDVLPGSKAAIYVMAADGTGLVRVTGETYQAGSPTWSK